MGLGCYVVFYWVDTPLIHVLDGYFEMVPFEADVNILVHVCVFVL